MKKDDRRLRIGLLGCGPISQVAHLDAIRKAPNAELCAICSSADAAEGKELIPPARGPRFARTTIGVWLGGVVLGTVGCIVGIRLPYHHPVAVVMSVLWWSLYLGGLGASIGALIAVLTEPVTVPPSGGVQGRS
jgi:hypothetical protein